MLARPGTTADLGREGFVFEPKLDGTRAICYKNASLRFVNRRDNDITSRYPEFGFSADIKAKSCVLDGEVVVFDQKGDPSFRLLQKREHSSPQTYHLLAKSHPATYVVFDILELDGRDLTRLPWGDRRKILLQTITEGPFLRTMVGSKDGHKLWGLVDARGIEGVMAKRVDSPYEEGRRSPYWIKIKTTMTVECVIVGFTHERRNLSALALGLYSGNNLSYVGRVGTGFTDDMADGLRGRLGPLIVEKPPVTDPPENEVTWVRPELVCEVEYLEVTPGGHLRAPSFRRLRDDRRPEECTMEQLSI